MNLIEVYIQEVTRRLPEKNRADIGLELRSTIEDMLPDEYGEKDVEEALGKLGNPAALASGYMDRPMHLIGPRYYDVYVSLLKLILPLSAVVALVSVFAESFLSFQDESVLTIVLTLIGEGIWRMLEVGVQIFFWLTIVFAILERTDKGKDQEPLAASLKKWTPEDLKSIPYIPKKKVISKGEVFGALLWTAIWGTGYLYANQLVGIYEGGGGGLDFVTPAFQPDVLHSYWPLVLAVIIMEIGLALYKMIKRQWTGKIAIFNAILQLAASISFIIIIANPDIMTLSFLTYLGNQFETTVGQMRTWIVSGSIAIFVLSAVWVAYDGFRKARIR